MRSTGTTISTSHILIAICTCQKYADKREAVRETWFPRGETGVEARFFMGCGKAVEENDTVVLDVADDYEHLPEKVIAFFQHALEHFEFEWLFKCDDDTFVAVDRLRELTRPEHDFIGNVSLLTENFASGGAGYLIRRWLVEAIVREGRVPDSGFEDRLISDEAFRLGAVVHASPHLGNEVANAIPQRDNSQITCHWISPAKMRALHTQLRMEPVRRVTVRHPAWHDDLLPPDGQGRGIGGGMHAFDPDFTPGAVTVETPAGNASTSVAKEAEPLRVVLGTDAAGIEPNATLLASLLRHTAAPLHVRIFSRDLPERFLVSGRLTLEVIRTPEELRFTGRTQAHVSSAGAFDRMAALACCPDWDRAVVFDYDQLVIGDPTELFQMDLTDTLAAVRLWPGVSLGHACREFVGEPLSGPWRECEDYRFFHMGPVLNLVAMREARTLERFTEFHQKCGMEEQVALCAACEDRITGFDEKLNWFPSWGAVPNDARVVHFNGAHKPWKDPDLYAASLWRAYETTWQELTCGIWDSQPGNEERMLKNDAVTSDALRASRREYDAMRVLEIGGWDFSRMVRTAREWLRTPQDRWRVMFRPHVDPEALEQAIERFGAGLGGLAGRTEVMDGEPTEALAWLMAQDDTWEQLDAVILHAPRNSASFLTEASMAWKLLRPGGLMLIHPVAKEPGRAGFDAFHDALAFFMKTYRDLMHCGKEDALLIKKDGPVALCKLPSAAMGQSGTSAMNALSEIVGKYASDADQPVIKTLVLEMQGRLGNQMFQYAHALALSEKLGMDLLVTHEHGAGACELGLFGIHPASEIPRTGRTIECEGEFRADQAWETETRILACGESSIRLRGFFQNESAFAPVADEIRSLFGIQPTELDVAGGTPVCVHVRRGDFVGSPKHDLCTPDYYDLAMKMVSTMIHQPVFFVISDDPEWCEAQLPPRDDMRIIPPHKEAEALSFMMGCKAFILSNSTFGWWGAWLSKAHPVIAPTQFLAGQNWDIVPERWMRIPCTGIGSQNGADNNSKMKYVIMSYPTAGTQSTSSRRNPGRE